MDASFSAADTNLPARDRLLVAARELLTEQPIDTITVRAIAARAGVGHSLITRHYGSRSALLIRAIGGALIEMAVDIARAPDAHAAVRAAYQHVQENRQLAAAVNVVASASDAVETREGFPIVEALASRLEASGADPALARERAATVIIMIFTWAAAEDRWLRMSGYGDDATTGRYQFLQTLLEMVDATLDATPSGSRQVS